MVFQGKMSLTKDLYSVFVTTDENKPINICGDSVELTSGKLYNIAVLNHNTRNSIRVSIDGGNENKVPTSTIKTLAPIDQGADVVCIMINNIVTHTRSRTPPTPPCFFRFSSLPYGTPCHLPEPFTPMEVEEIEEINTTVFLTLEVKWMKKNTSKSTMSMNGSD